MNKKKTSIAIAFVCTVVCASILITNISKAAARKKYQPLLGVSVVLDAGHGGKDDGARAQQVKEQEINLKITQKLETLLSEKGATVILTRDGKYDLASEDATNRKKEDMKKRIEIINQEKTDLFLSIHLNAYPNASVKGAQAFYEKGNEVSKVFADMVQKHFKELTGTKMTSKTGDYYILNNANKVGALVECGFLSNAEDLAKLITEDYQQKIAKSLYDSIEEYFQMIL